MKRIFVTYGDENYEVAKQSIAKQAFQTQQFDEIFLFGPSDLSERLKNSGLLKIGRGGGLWSWKPDVILKVMKTATNGDIIVYCDSGCTLQKTKEWKKYWTILSKYDIIAQRIFKRTDHWTRKELIDFINLDDKRWLKCYQYQATILLTVSDFTRNFVLEWRNLMISHPEFVKDVTAEEKNKQHKSFIESRHDQSVYSSLIYKYLNDPQKKSKIFTQWEHVEGNDIISKQAIRATRLRQGETESVKLRIKRTYKWAIKCFIFKPFYFAPRQWFYSRSLG